jgi:hypothetical protein
MNVSTLIEEEKKSAAIEPSITEQLPLTEVPEISRSAWKVIILLLAGRRAFLGHCGRLRLIFTS